MLTAESDNWIKRYNREFRRQDLDSYIEGVLEAQTLLRGTFLTADGEPKPSDPERAWVVVCNLWAVLTTHHLGNPWKLLEGGKDKAYLAKQLDALVAASCHDLDRDDISHVGYFGGLGESMRTEI